MGRRRSSAVSKLFIWVRMQSTKVKAGLAISVAVFLLIALRFLFKDIDYFFIAAEAIHAAGIAVLVYKLTTQHNCSGLSLRTQELTAIFLAARMYCSFVIEGDIHTWLDFSSIVSTAWVIYMMRFKLKSTYVSELDDTPLYYLLVPAFILAMIVHPFREYSIVSILWAFCGYLEAVSVLPQLLMIRKTKMIEPSTAHYVFALGMSRFFNCAHYIFLAYETKGAFLFASRSGLLWAPLCVLAEIVQTLILADFCYYYIKSFVNGHTLSQLPV